MRSVNYCRGSAGWWGLSPQEFNVDVFATPRQIVDWMGGYFGMRAAARKSRN